MTPTTAIEAPRETDTPSLGEFIVSTPDTCGGEPRIAGTRIKVRHVVGWVEVAGGSVAYVIEQFPHLTRAGIHAALAYYWAHKDEIDAADADEDRYVAELKAAAGPSLVSQKLAEREKQRAANDSLPS